jgi:hypothetical protein
MQFSFRSALLGLAAAGSLTLTASAAWAGCGDQPNPAPAAWRSAPAGDMDARLIRVNNGAPSMIGLWYEQFFVGGSLFDFGYTQWHSDGTELLNSGARSPASQNYCLGVWEQTGPFSYHLNHFALSYDPGTGKINARVNIKEDVQVDQKGQTFTGSFTIDVFAPDGSGPPARVAAGNVTGKRLTAN